VLLLGMLRDGFHLSGWLNVTGSRLLTARLLCLLFGIQLIDYRSLLIAVLLAVEPVINGCQQDPVLYEVRVLPDYVFEQR
jgi:hypothetical protein